MMSRFFKKKPAPPEPKKALPASRKKASPAKEVPMEKPLKSKKLLTAEGWKRMMMRKSRKS